MANSPAEKKKKKAPSPRVGGPWWSRWLSRVLLMLSWLAGAGATFWLEIRGLSDGHLRYAAIALAAWTGFACLSGFVGTYNRLVDARKAGTLTATRNQLKFSTEKIALLGIAGPLVAVALGLYYLDSINQEANFGKYIRVHEKIIPRMDLLGCNTTPRVEDRRCREFNDALGGLQEAVLASDVKGMSDGVAKVRIAWADLVGARQPRYFQEYQALIQGLDELEYRSDAWRQASAFLLGLLLLPLVSMTTSRKLALAAYEAKFSAARVTYWGVLWRVLASPFARIPLRRSAAALAGWLRRRRRPAAPDQASAASAPPPAPLRSAPPPPKDSPGTV